MAYDSNPVGQKTGIPEFPFPSPFREQIKGGQLCLGTATPSTSDLGVVATIINKNIDWLWIDCEHGWASTIGVRPTMEDGHILGVPLALGLLLASPFMARPPPPRTTSG